MAEERRLHINRLLVDGYISEEVVMKYIFIGRIVNTHALKGEVRIVSDFEFKDRIFKENTLLYIGENKDKEIIETYRKHKQFDMVKYSIRRYFFIQYFHADTVYRIVLCIYNFIPLIKIYFLLKNR